MTDPHAISGVTKSEACGADRLSREGDGAVVGDGWAGVGGEQIVLLPTRNSAPLKRECIYADSLALVELGGQEFRAHVDELLGRAVSHR